MADKKSPGRPPKRADQRRNCKLTVVCTQRELSEFAWSAKAADLDLSMWARVNLLAITKRMKEVIS
jgi:hypothetical protein